MNAEVGLKWVLADEAEARGSRILCSGHTLGPHSNSSFGQGGRWMKLQLHDLKVKKWLS